MKLATTALIVICLVSVGACSTRSLYGGVREGARNQCNEKVSEADRNECLQRTQDSYDEYNRKRAEVSKDRG